VELDADSFELVELTDEPFDVVLVDGEPLVWYPEGEPFVTVRGANATTPRTGVVTVDAGAISFVSDGADVMRPGITEADDDIEEGDLVVIRRSPTGRRWPSGARSRAATRWSGRRGRSSRASTTSATNCTSSPSDYSASPFAASSSSSISSS